MRIAAIDIGTNSIRLLVAEVNDFREMTILSRDLVTTRLGENLQGGVLLPQAICRTVEALVKFQQIIKSYGVDKVAVMATSAVRDASNREEFIRLIENKLDWKVQVLSGEEEARLGYLGVLAGLSIDPASTAVLVVGGGSTELIWGTGKELHFQSVDIGAVRVTEADYSEEEISGLLGPVLSKIKRSQIKNLVGAGGTVTTLAAIDQELKAYDPQKVHGYFLDVNRIRGILESLRVLSIEERKKVPGLQPERADIIVAGIGIVLVILENLGLPGVLASEADLLYGAVLSFLLDRKKEMYYDYLIDKRKEEEKWK